jgi:hypothetical protein
VQDEQTAREREREEKRHKNTRPSRELAVYAGAYEDGGYGKVLVTLEGNALFIQWSTFKSKLHHFHYDTFTTSGDNPLGDELVLFSLGPTGEIASMNLLGVEFKKSQPRTEAAGTSR